MCEVLEDLFDGVLLMLLLVIIGFGEVLMWIVDFIVFDLVKLVKFDEVGW